METDSPHNNIKISDQEQSCEHCEKTFKINSDLKDHMKRVHKDTMHKLNQSDSLSTEKVSNESDFQYPIKNPFPPDHSQVIMNTLNIVLQKMEKMEVLFKQKF